MTTVKVILDTAVAECLWNGGQGSEWLYRIANGDVSAAMTTASLAELVRKTPSRKADIQLTALASMTEIIDLNAGIARAAGKIARELDCDDSATMPSAVVAATAIESAIPVACIDDEFFAAMGCKVAKLEN